MVLEFVAVKEFGKELGNDQHHSGSRSVFNFILHAAKS